MGKLFVIGDKYTVALFKLIGAEGKEIQDFRQAIATINEVRRREDVVLVFITKDIYEAISTTIDELMLNTVRPMISVIPSPFSEAKPIDSKKLINKALGFG
ncbi:ATP synthase subunit F [Sulfolobales archaeon HS-7]|nr:ATP synthase subunit F [Sulfolobales archaeon HS-7]